jgi:hypothetical protein
MHRIRGAVARPLTFEFHLSIVIGHPGPTTATDADVYIAHALINPAGADPGHEIFVLANLATAPPTFNGWQLTDHNNRSTTIHATIPAGATTPIALDGNGVQLGNNGGNLILHNATGTMIDSVVYSNTDADSEDRYVRFRH